MIKLFLSLVTIHGAISAPGNVFIRYGVPSENNSPEGSSPWITPEPSQLPGELPARNNIEEKGHSSEPFPIPPDLNQGSISSPLIIDKVPIPADDLELPRYEYNQGWLLQPLETNRVDHTVRIGSDVQPNVAQVSPQPRPTLDVGLESDASGIGFGSYPSKAEPEPYPPASEPAPYPSAAESGPYPPASEPVPYPPASEPVPYPSAAESGPYPPASEPVPYPSAAESKPYPPALESGSDSSSIASGPYPPESESGSDSSSIASGPYPPESESGSDSSSIASGPYPPESESGSDSSSIASGPYSPETSSSYQYPSQTAPGSDLGEKGSEIGVTGLVANGNAPPTLPSSLVPTVESYNGGEYSLGSSVQSQFVQPSPSGGPNALVIPTGTKIKVQDAHGQYSHGFANADGTQIQESGHLISTDNGWEYVIAKEGSYSYLSPENIPIYVRYIADDKGYRVISQNFAGR